MSIEKHVKEFLKALNGGPGALDAWLECNNEAECRAAINGAIAAERERWKQAAEAMAQEADNRFTMDGTTAHWLRTLAAKCADNA